MYIFSQILSSPWPPPSYSSNKSSILSRRGETFQLQYYYSVHQSVVRVFWKQNNPMSKLEDLAFNFYPRLPHSWKENRDRIRILQFSADCTLGRELGSKQDAAAIDLGRPRVALQNPFRWKPKRKVFASGSLKVKYQKIWTNESSGTKWSNGRDTRRRHQKLDCVGENGTFGNLCSIQSGKIPV